MTFYEATLVELLIIELFVFAIWFKVLLESIALKDATLASKKLVLTSIGLVLSSLAVAGIMGFRIYEATVLTPPSLWAITSFYIILAISGFLFMVGAAIGSTAKILKAFLAVTIVWTIVAVFLAYN